MPHVDDGTLHALLDGALRAEDPARADVVEAHLETCPDCRALLERAADLRAGAAGILAMVQPDARPDFQEVLVLAGHAPDGIQTASPPAPVTSGRGRRARATRAIAWAATVVLALGTGYLVRDLVETEPGAGAMLAADRPAPQLGRRSADHGPGEEVTLERGEEAVRELADAAELPRTAGTTRAAAPVPTTRDAGAPREVDTPEAPAPVPARVPAPVADAGQAAEPLGAPAPPAVAGPPQALALDRIVATEAARADAEGQGLFRGRRAAENLLEGAQWRPVTLEEARALMAGAVYVLPDAEIVWLLGDPAAAEVRSLQRLSEGLEVMVTQHRIDRPRPTPGDDPAMAQGVTVLHDRHWLTVVGTLPARSLEALAAAARPVQDGDGPR